MRKRIRATIRKKQNRDFEVSILSFKLKIELLKSNRKLVKTHFGISTFFITLTLILKFLL